MTAPRVLVTGATGVIGPAVVDALAAAGWSVRTFVRVPPDVAPWSAPAALAMGSLEDIHSVVRAVHDVQLVVHLAAKLHINAPTDAEVCEYGAVNVEGTRHVVDAARRAGARVILASTIAVYGATHGRDVDERAAPAPDTAYARSKIEAESLVLDASDGRSPGTVLRLGAVYGPRMKGNYRRLVRGLARGWFIPVGACRNRRSLVHERDAARAFAVTAGRADSAGRVYNVTDGQVHEMRDILSAIAAALERRAPRFALPAKPVRLACGTAERAARLVGWRSPITRDTLDKWLEDLAVSAVRVRTELGFVPSIPLDVGWRQTVEAMRSAGDL